MRLPRSVALWSSIVLFYSAMPKDCIDALAKKRKEKKEKKSRVDGAQDDRVNAAVAVVKKCCCCYSSYTNDGAWFFMVSDYVLFYGALD